MLSNALMAGGLTLAASFFLGLKQILGGPRAVNYPSQRPGTRVVSFALSAMLMLRGSDLLLGCLHGAPEPLHFSAVTGSFAIATFFGVRLWDMLHMRAPARFYRKFDRAMRALNCPPWFDPLTRARREALLAVHPWARPQHVPGADEARAALAEGIMGGVDLIAAPGEPPSTLRRLH